MAGAQGLRSPIVAGATAGPSVGAGALQLLLSEILPKGRRFRDKQPGRSLQSSPVLLIG